MTDIYWVLPPDEGPLMAVFCLMQQAENGQKLTVAA